MTSKESDKAFHYGAIRRRYSEAGTVGQYPPPSAGWLPAHATRDVGAWGSVSLHPSPFSVVPAHVPKDD